MQGKCVLMVALLAAVSAVSSSHELPDIYKDLAKLPAHLMAARLRSLLLPELRSAIDDQIIALLEKLRAGMGEPNPSLGLPALDPLQVAHLDLDLNADIAQINGTLDALKVSKLSTFQIDLVKLQILLLSLSFGFSLPEIVAEGNYDIDGVLGGVLPVYGKGPFDVHVQNLSVSGTVKLGSNNSYIYIKSFDLDFSLAAIKTNFTGLLGGGELSDVTNEILSDMIPTLVADNKVAIAGAISDKIVTMANQLLDGKTLQDILDLINGGGSSRRFRI